MRHRLDNTHVDKMIDQTWMTDKIHYTVVVGTPCQLVWITLGEAFHQNTLEALRELVQAAGLNHPGDISASHIVRRISGSDVRLLTNLLPLVKPGELVEAIAGRADWPHNVFRLYWPMSRADSFAPTAPLHAA